MNIDLVHPELRKVVKFIPSIPFHNRLFLAFYNGVMRCLPKAKSGDGVSIFEQPVKQARVRVYRPEGDLSGAAILWIHGGGMISGTAALDDRCCLNYAEKLKLVVISVDYRLAPTHPFPCALDDCVDAWQWLLDNAADLAIDPARIAIAGQSAGGGLAASLAHKIFDQGGRQPAAQALFCPMLDDRTAEQRDRDPIKHRMWNNKNNRAAWSWYLGYDQSETALLPYAVPSRREALSGLPNTWIGVGDIDLFYEENTNYAIRLRQAGVMCQLDVASMAPHAFESLVPDASISREFWNKNYDFLRQKLKL